MFIFSTKALRSYQCFIFSTFFCQLLSAQIIISQYYEGDVNDKFLEITNVSGVLIDQANSRFFICVFSNENAADPLGKKPGLSTRIEVNLLPGETVTYKNPLAVNPSHAAHEGIGALIGAFNGNDVLVITTSKDETAWQNRIDVIGHSGDWGIDKSFYRKITIEKPNPDYTSDEWVEVTLTMVNGAGETAVERLGYHFYNCQQPTFASSNITFSNISDTSLDVQWNQGDGSSRLIIARAYQAVTALPLNGVSYNGSAAFGSGDAFNGGFVVYSGWENSFSLTNLIPSTPYFISIFEFSCSPPQYYTTVFASSQETTLAPIPRIFTTLEESGLDFGLVHAGDGSTVSQITVSWENLKSGITATVDDPFEISSDQGNWAGEMIIPFSESGVINMYIRFSPDQADGIHQKTLTLSSPGAEEITRPLRGTAFPNAWINEFHYDNIGADVGEFVEITLQYPEKYDLSAFKLQLCNGSSGLVYDQESVDNFIPGEKINNFGIYFWPAPDIQNGQPGGPDGMVLGIEDQVIMFLSYEGVFTAGDGLATGTTSADIGLEESDETTVEGLSLQLENSGLTGDVIQGSGMKYKDFVWTTGLESPGHMNSNQILPVKFGHFSAIRQGSTAVLSWQTLTEVNNLGFEIQKSIQRNPFEKIGFIPGKGNSSEPLTYNFTDEKFSESCYYKLKQIDYDGRYSFSPVISLKRPKSHVSSFLISPNPVRQKLDITTADDIQSGPVEMELLSIHGKKILQSKGDLVKIRDRINGCLKNLQKGAYLLKLQNDWQSETHILLKE
ncbi:MAG: hypothetical protein MI921_25635 [Cytophagales bacterium]|nr:hypothetical protein [Cytophagales bacterium]